MPRRLRPILMTTFALIDGMLPVCTGAQRRRPPRADRTGLIGGAMISTLLTLLVISTAYETQRLQAIRRWAFN